MLIAASFAVSGKNFVCYPFAEAVRNGTRLNGITTVQYQSIEARFVDDAHLLASAEGVG